MSQKQNTFRSDEKGFEMLKELAEANTRTMSQQINALIKEAYARFKQEQQNDAA